MPSLVLETIHIQSGFLLNISTYGQQNYNWKGLQQKSTTWRDSEIAPSYSFSSLTSPTLAALELAWHLMSILGIAWTLGKNYPMESKARMRRLRLHKSLIQ